MTSICGDVRLFTSNNATYGGIRHYTLNSTIGIDKGLMDWIRVCCLPQCPIPV
jgi:hypothetical protein